VAATVDIYRALSEQLLPTPSKSHYLFNTRDLAKIVQGLSQVGGWVGGWVVPGVVRWHPLPGQKQGRDLACAMQCSAASALPTYIPAGLQVSVR
jgi:hypothetical protein